VNESRDERELPEPAEAEPPPPAPEPPPADKNLLDDAWAEEDPLEIR
jgi:hypothetical protein